MSAEKAFGSGGAAKLSLHRSRPKFFAVTLVVIFSAYGLQEEGAKDELEVKMWMRVEFISSESLGNVSELLSGHSYSMRPNSRFRRNSNKY
jgi:hypothetical protein